MDGTPKVLVTTDCQVHLLSVVLETYVVAKPDLFSRVLFSFLAPFADGRTFLPQICVKKGQKQRFLGRGIVAGVRC